MSQSTPLIVSADIVAVVVPMAEPHRTASGVITASPLVLLTLTTDAGIAGHGIAFTYTPSALKPTADMLQNVAQLLVGEAVAPAAQHLALQKRFRLLGTQGLLGMALAAIDMALWDIHAQVAGQPLARLLGAHSRPTPAYGAVGYDGEVGSARTAEAWAKRGFRGVKAKIGYATATADAAVVRAMRQAAGPDVAIMVDYNQSLLPHEAIARIQSLADLGLAWVEEPTLAEDYAGHAHISARVSTPIQAGENWWSALEFDKAIAANATDYLMPDVMKVGGVTEWMHVASLAAARGLPVSSHLFGEVSAQLLAATPTAHWLEYADWWNPIMAEPLAVKDGCAQPSEAPGNGMRWNAAAVNKLRA